MKLSYVSVLALSLLFSWLGLNNSSLDHQPSDISAIAEQTKQGVEVKIAQLQIQRIAGEVKLSKPFGKFAVDEAPYRRTIAFSILQKGTGNSSGPAMVTLNNGKRPSHRMSSNQQMMSRMANAQTPDGYQFMEYWFEVPADTKFSDIFPITIQYETTTKDQAKVSFEFEVTP